MAQPRNSGGNPSGHETHGLLARELKGKGICQRAKAFLNRMPWDKLTQQGGNPAQKSRSKERGVNLGKKAKCEKNCRIANRGKKNRQGQGRNQALRIAGPFRSLEKLAREPYQGRREGKSSYRKKNRDPQKKGTSTQGKR